MPVTGQLLPGVRQLPTGYDVANSCRFETNTYMTKSATSGNTKTFTISFWVKRTDLGAVPSGSNQFPISFYQDSNNRVSFAFTTDNTFVVYAGVSGSTKLYFVTNRVFRDISAWMHFVIKVDTTQSTEANRFKLYINGVEETSFSTATYPSQNDDLIVNTNIYVGVYDTTNNFYHGYLTEVVYIDGTALDQSSFGQFDSDSPNIWKPIDVSGLTFGTNGFYLDFEDSSNLGNDANGGTDLTEYNLATTDQSTDTCTNNFATINSLDYNLTSFSEGNLKLNWSQAPNNFGLTTGTIGITSGKWYWEAKITSPDNSTGIGLGVIQVEPYLSRETATGVDPSLFYGLGARFTTAKAINKTSNNVDSSISDTWTNDVIIRIAYDGDAGKIYMWKGTTELNGQTFSSSTSFNNATLTAETLVLPFVSLGDGGSGTKTSQVEFNFGGTQSFTISSGNSDGNGYGNFEYSVPSGYYSLNTKNLAEFG